MRSQVLIESFTSIAKDKNIDRTELGTILEELFMSLLERHFHDASNCSVIVNIDKGEIEIYQEKTIVLDVEDPVYEIELEKARVIEPDLEVGDIFIEVIDPVIFGRRLILSAKQFLAQKIRDIEKKYVFEDYYQKVGEIVIGDVRQVYKDNVYVHIDQCELLMPKSERIEFERYRRGDTIRAIVKSVEMTPRGPNIIISRSDNQFLFKLFEMEVPEIEDGIIQILSIARAPGERSKIIVKSSDKRIDAVGACVGMRGSRIQAIVRELNGERIDVINYSAQTEVLISRALSPAKPINLYIDDEKKYCMAIFDDEDMESGVGKGYQNVILASRVSGYSIEAVKKSEYEREKEPKYDEVNLNQIKDLTPRMVSLLEQVDVYTTRDFQNTARDTLLSIKGVGEKLVDTMSERIQSFFDNMDENGKSEEDIEDIKEIVEKGELTLEGAIEE